MARILASWLWVLRKIRLHYDVIGHIAAICFLVLGVLDYGYSFHGRDLLWWRQKVLQEEITPLSVLLHIGGVKIAIILVLTMWSYTRQAAERRWQRQRDMPITCVRKRYCRFLIMRLLASLDQLIHHHPRMEDFLERHKDFADAVELFRWQARKLFERTDLQLCLPLHEVLSVDDQQEQDLLHQGYDEKLQRLREMDIHMMVYEN
ncbi:uncharacterized protein LOC108034653 [Drosophila biarmipes]|uniref:uncharacterized protein LOC108034653 n=1 Tax=Drosophila biarmipes TaxID=125945 RepID=UPI0007E6D42A|nr:uncharacterized protein LOC108034653 [Drosophila biarmipes]